MENTVSHFRRTNNYIKKPTYGEKRDLAMDVAVVIQLEQLMKTAAMLHYIKPKKSSSAVPLSSVRFHL